MLYRGDVCVARVSCVFIVVAVGDAPQSILAGDCASHHQGVQNRRLMLSIVTTAEWIKCVLTVLERHFGCMYEGIRVALRLYFDAQRRVSTGMMDAKSDGHSDEDKRLESLGYMKLSEACDSGDVESGETCECQQPRR
jgi:hypothetical protein